MVGTAVQEHTNTGHGGIHLTRDGGEGRGGEGREGRGGSGGEGGKGREWRGGELRSLCVHVLEASSIGDNADYVGTHIVVHTYAPVSCSWSTP